MYVPIQLIEIKCSCKGKSMNSQGYINYNAETNSYQLNKNNMYYDKVQL